VNAEENDQITVAEPGPRQVSSYAVTIAAAL
jgi:hypothetical protein